MTVNQKIGRFNYSPVELITEYIDTTETYLTNISLKNTLLNDADDHIFIIGKL